MSAHKSHVIETSLFTGVMCWLAQRLVSFRCQFTKPACIQHLKGRNTSIRRYKNNHIDLRKLHCPGSSVTRVHFWAVKGGLYQIMMQQNWILFFMSGIFYLG